MKKYIYTTILFFILSYGFSQEKDFNFSFTGVDLYEEIDEIVEKFDSSLFKRLQLSFNKNKISCNLTVSNFSASLINVSNVKGIDQFILNDTLHLVSTGLSYFGSNFEVIYLNLPNYTVVIFSNAREDPLNILSNFIEKYLEGESKIYLLNLLNDFHEGLNKPIISHKIIQCKWQFERIEVKDANDNAPD